MLRSKRTVFGILCATALLIATLVWIDGPISGTATTADADLSTLDYGGLAGRSVAEPRNDKERYSRIIESVRMAEAVVNPGDLDASLRAKLPSPLPKPSDTTGILADVARPILIKYGMLAGYSIEGVRDCQPKDCAKAINAWTTRITLLRLPDEAAARAAAAEIEAADFAVNPDNVAVSLPEYPAALGHWRPSVPTLGIVLAHGTFIVTVFITYPITDLGALTGLAAKTLAAELPVLERFQPTSVQDLPNLPFDPEGMLRRMVLTTHDEWPYPYITKLQPDTQAGAGLSIQASGVAYGPTGALHWLPGAPEAARIDSGAIESVALVDQRWLIRLRDAVSARRFAVEESVSTLRQTPMAAPPIPDATCLREEAILPKYYCIVQDGRYVAIVQAIDQKSAHQMAAAQYALLVRNR